MQLAYTKDRGPFWKYTNSANNKTTAMTTGYKITLCFLFETSILLKNFFLTPKSTKNEIIPVKTTERNVQYSERLKSDVDV